MSSSRNFKKAKLVDGPWIVENICLLETAEGSTENHVAAEVYKAMVFEGSVYPDAQPCTCLNCDSTLLIETSATFASLC